MSVYMLKTRLRQAQEELANATHIREAIRDVESIEWHGQGWRSRERNA